MEELRFVLNGTPVRLACPPERRMLDLLRNDLHLTGTKEGCGEGECGACTILVNGEAMPACLMLAGQAQGTEITTIEGLARDGVLHPLQQAFIDHIAVSCGFCTPGMILAAKALLDRLPDPSEQQIREALAGNICRCSGYEGIIAAVLEAARLLREESKCR